MVAWGTVLWLQGSWCHFRLGLLPNCSAVAGGSTRRQALEREHVDFSNHHKGRGEVSWVHLPLGTLLFPAARVFETALAPKEPEEKTWPAAPERSAPRLCSWCLAQVTEAVVKTHGQDLEIQEDHWVIILLMIQQKRSRFQCILLCGRQSHHTPTTG